MHQMLKKELPNGKNVLGFKKKDGNYKMIKNGESVDLELYAGDIINLNDDFFLVLPVLQSFDNGTRLDYFSLTKISIVFKSPLTVLFTKNRSSLNMLKDSSVYVLGNVYNKLSDLVLSSVFTKRSFKQYKPKIIKELNLLLETMQKVPVRSGSDFKKDKKSYN